LDKTLASQDFIRLGLGPTHRIAQRWCAAGRVACPVFG